MRHDVDRLIRQLRRVGASVGGSLAGQPGAVRGPRSDGSSVEHVRTELHWDDVVLPPATMRQLRDIEQRLRSEGTEDDRVTGRGDRVLFHGPAGSGKTAVAALLGKATNRPVLRVDLSRVVSEYIGETEKNLSAVLDRAERGDWILLFDEADALFGKRTRVRDAHDRYADQETAYLLQRIESHRGLVVVATSRRDDLDEEVLRGFRAEVGFPAPTTLRRRRKRPR